MLNLSDFFNLTRKRKLRTVLNTIIMNEQYISEKQQEVLLKLAEEAGTDNIIELITSVGTYIGTVENCEGDLSSGHYGVWVSTEKGNFSPKEGTPKKVYFKLKRHKDILMFRYRLIEDYRYYNSDKSV